MNSQNRHLALIDAALGMGLVTEENRNRLLTSEQPVLRQLVEEHGLQSTDVIRLLAHTYRQEPPSHSSIRDRISTVDEDRPDPLEGRTVLGPYRILEELGRGGMGIVYKAHQVVLDRLIALKVIQTTGDAQHPRMARFRREALAAARLSHPNILRVYDLGYTDGVYFLAMELIEGYPLDLYLQDLGRNPRVILPIVSTIGSALEYAHQQGVIHRDVKPSNILIDERGTPYLADFGVAKLIGERSPLISTRLGSLVGTVQYMSPEQLLGQHPSVDERTDVYSLGVTLYELLTHRLPYDPLQERNPARWEEAAPPSHFNPAIDDPLDRITMKALHLRLGARYRNVAAFRGDLDRYLEGRPISLITTRYRPFSYLLSHRTGWVRSISTILFGLFLGLIVSQFLLSPSIPPPSPAPKPISIQSSLASAERSNRIVNHLPFYGIERAESELSRLAKEEPENAWIPLNQARLRWRENDRLDALAILDTMATPRLPEAIFLLGLDALTTGQPERAETFSRRLANHSEGTWTLCAEAMRLWSLALRATDHENRQQLLDQANRILEDTLQEEPDFEPALFLRLEMSARVRNWKTADFFLLQCLRLRPGGHDLLCRQGEFLLKRKEWTQARNHFDQALKVIPQSVRARIGRARSWVAQDQLSRALREIDRALEMDPRRIDAWIVRAQIRDSLESFPMALQDFQQAEALAPRDPYLRIARGHLRLRRGQPKEAIEDLQIALEVAPAHPRPHACLGEVHLLQGRYDEARSAFQQALLLRDHDPNRIQAGLGAAKALSGYLEEGLKILDSALLDAKEDPQIHAWLGQVHHARKAHNEARNHLNRALRLDNRCPAYFLQRAKVREAIGDTSEARSDRKRAEELLRKLRNPVPKYKHLPPNPR